MMRRLGMALAVVALAIVAVALAGGAMAAAQPIGDAANGRKLAEAWCSECHAITAYPVVGPRRGPDFMEVARQARTTTLSLNVFLRSNHDNMPNFILQRGEADDIVSYIMSLKPQ